MRLIQFYSDHLKKNEKETIPIVEGTVQIGVYPDNERF